MPAAVTPPARPDKISTAEELLLAGQRLEQFYSPAREPDAYYEEALKRTPRITVRIPRSACCITGEVCSSRPNSGSR